MSTVGAQIETAIFGEEVAGARLAIRVRLVCVPILLAFLLLETVNPKTAWFIQACLVIYLLLGVAQLGVMRWIRRGSLRTAVTYLVVALEMATFAFAMFGSQAFFNHPLPPPSFLDARTVVYLFFVLALVAYSFSPLLMLWAALWAGLTWSAGMLWLLSLPDTIAEWHTGVGE